MTRFLEPYELHEILVASGDTIALELAALFKDGTSTELVALKPAATSTLLPTYETRLARAEARLGPRTEGLERFVAALRVERTVEMFSVRRGGVVGVGLLAPDGELVAITMVRASG